MKPKNLNLPRIIISSVFLVVILYLSVNTIIESKTRQSVVTDNAEVKNIKYGLFSVNAWKEQVYIIISNEIKEFELSSGNKKELNEFTEKKLYEFLDSIEKMISDKQKKQGFVVGLLSNIYQNLVLSIDDLRKKVPEFSKSIIDELNKDETKKQLSGFVQNKFDDYMDETNQDKDLSEIKRIEQKYNCKGIKNCNTFLQSELDKHNNKLKDNSLLIIIFTIIVFLIILIKNINISLIEFYILIILLGVLLLVGITTPMIDIDARISNFKFLIMENPIEFKDQVIFFQSKSIIDVVRILFATKELQSIIVGSLIFLFSIIFPFSKLLASILLLKNKKLINNKLVNFFALKSGKWSMADVIVVAIFMSYIGFKGIISSQLSQIENIHSNTEIITTDFSNLGVGFNLFLTFTIGGLVFASIISKQLKVKKDVFSK